MSNVSASRRPARVPETLQSVPRKTMKIVRSLVYKRIDHLIGRSVFTVVSHPKSGRTWLGIALGRVLETMYGVPHEALLKPYDYLKPFQPEIPRVIFKHLMSRQLLAAKGEIPLAGKRLILLVRDPRDVAVSYFYQMTQRKKMFAGNLPEFIRDQSLGIVKIVAYMNYFARHWDRCPDSMVIRYEAMKADMGAELIRLCHAIGLNPPDETIADAVDWARFDNMQDRERGGYYHRKLSWLNPRDSADTDTFKARKGRVGSYCDDLTVEDIAYLDGYIATHLDDHFAYYKTVHNETAQFPAPLPLLNQVNQMNV